MTPDDMIGELASELQYVFRNLDEGYLHEHPEDAFINLAARLVLRLKKTTFVPVPSRATMLQRAEGEAALRIFDILTVWLRKHPKMRCVTCFTPEGKFEFMALDTVDGVMPYPRTQTFAFFQGESVQDAYAQAAQTIEMNEGAL